jgi:pyruvate kinase
MPRRTKIVATLGPATDSPDRMEQILRAGVNVARINFSHGDSPDEHLNRITRFRTAAEKVGVVAAVMADLPGPKLRARITSPRELTPGAILAFSLGKAPVEPDDIVITEPEMLREVKAGHRILLDDGRLQLQADDPGTSRLMARVTVGGTLFPNKGINLPDTPLSFGAVTERDLVALAIAARGRVDWVALSFVRVPEAAAEVRAAMATVGLHCPVLAKMERPEAVARMADITRAFDGIMVARGDLGVEIPLERVPMVQKRLITEARAAGKPVITATDMLDSMRDNPRPTRAEASDVANAIFDGTDAVMLSGETAVGSYPVESVACMARIAEEIEGEMEKRFVGNPVFNLPFTAGEAVDDPLAQAACELSAELPHVAAIITPTVSGRTARLVARHRPMARIIATAQQPAVLRSMAMIWGVTPVLMSPVPDGHDRISGAIRDAFRAGAVRVGDRVVVLSGHPVAGGGKLPTIRVVRIGEGGESSEP